MFLLEATLQTVKLYLLFMLVSIGYLTALCIFAAPVSSTSLSSAISVSFAPGGVSDSLHSNPNCSCFDRHESHILMVVDVLDISYYYQVLVAGAQRAAQDLGSELYIIPAPVFSASQMASSIQSSLSTPLFAYSQGPPDVIISALPGVTALDEPLATLLNVYQNHHIPFASIHSANINLTQSLGDYDSGFLYHIGADNYLLGQTAANELINRTHARNTSLARTALCLTDLLTNEASVDRCSGFATVLSTLGISTQVFEVNTLTQTFVPVTNVLTEHQQVNAAIPVLAIDAECTAVLLSSLTEYDLQSTQIRQGITSKQLVAIAAVDISPTTATALQQGIISVAFDEQPFFTGYMSVAIASLYIRTSTYPSNRFYSTSPLLIDNTTPLLIEHANAEAAGFIECSATIVTNCFNRSALVFESSHQLITSDPFGANVRSGLYQGTFDMRVQDSDLVQAVKINSNNVAQIENLAAGVAAGNISISGIIAVPRDPLTSQVYFQQLVALNIPLATFNNAYGTGLIWQGPFQPFAHVGTDDYALARSIAQRFIALQSCRQVSILDPDGSYASDDVYLAIESTIISAGIPAAIQPAYSVNPQQATQQILSYYLNGSNCFMLTNQDILLGILYDLDLLGKPTVYVGVQDYTPYSMALQAQGLLTFTAVQNEYYQGYLPVVLQTLLAITGGISRGNHALRTLYNIENTYYYATGFRFPYIETGPQFITSNTRNIQRIAACGSGVTGTFSNSVVLPAIIPITQYPFQQIAYPICLDPPANVYLVIVRQNTFQQMLQYANCSRTAAAQGIETQTTACVNPFNSTEMSISNVSYATAKNSAGLRDTNTVTGYSVMSGSASDFLLALLDFNLELLPSDTLASWTAQSSSKSLTVYTQLVSVVTQSSGTSSSSSGSLSSSVSQLGTTSASISSSSVANFSSYSVVSSPGSLVELQFYVSLPDGRTIYSNAVWLTYEPCSPGYFVQNENSLCALCPSGYTSYIIGATSCVIVQQSVPLAASISVRVIAGILLLALLSTMTLLLIKMKSRVVLSYSPVFCVISLSGLFLAVVSAMLTVDSGGDPIVCTTSTWLFNIGFTIAFAAVWAKTFRLWRIFGNPLLQMLSITNIQLLPVILGFVSVDIIVLILWNILSPYNTAPSDEKYITCVSTNADIFNAIFIAMKGLWLCSGAWLTSQIRRLPIPAKFNESHALAFAIYNMAAIGAATVGIWFGMRAAIGENAVHILLAIATLAAAAAVAACLFFPIVKQLYANMETRFFSKSSGAAGAEAAAISSRSSTSWKVNSTFSNRQINGAVLGNSPSPKPRGLRRFIGGGAANDFESENMSALNSGVSSANVKRKRPHGKLAESNDPVHTALTLTEDFEEIIRQIQMKSAVYPMEKAILDTYTKLKANRKKALEGYLGYKQDLVNIARLNAELFYQKRSGQLSADSLVPQPLSNLEERKVAASINAARGSISVRTLQHTHSFSAAGVTAPSSGLPSSPALQLTHLTQSAQLLQQTPGQQSSRHLTASTFTHTASSASISDQLLKQPIQEPQRERVLSVNIKVDENSLPVTFHVPIIAENFSTIRSLSMDANDPEILQAIKTHNNDTQTLSTTQTQSPSIPAVARRFEPNTG